jgi:hypothetical protein
MLSELYYRNKFLDQSECAQLIEHFKNNKQDSVRGMVGYPPNAKVDFMKRIDNVLILDPKEEHLKSIIDKIVDVTKQVNEDIFLFDVDWEHYKDPKNKSVFISEYDGSEKGHWAQHSTVNWISNYMQQKICSTLVLSETNDYEGGDILLFFGTTKDLPTPNELRARGILYIYPAFRFTQINPVLTGCKYHLDLRFSGPYWR